MQEYLLCRLQTAMSNVYIALVFNHFIWGSLLTEFVSFRSQSSHWPLGLSIKYNIQEWVEGWEKTVTGDKMKGGIHRLWSIFVCLFVLLFCDHLNP